MHAILIKLKSYSILYSLFIRYNIRIPPSASVEISFFLLTLLKLNAKKAFSDNLFEKIRLILNVQVLIYCKITKFKLVVTNSCILVNFHIIPFFLSGLLIQLIKIRLNT